MKTLRDSVTQASLTAPITQDKIYDAIQNLRELTVIMEDEGLLCLELSLTYVELARLCSLVGDTDSQRRKLRRALEVRLRCLGVGHPSSVGLAEEYSRLQ